MTIETDFEIGEEVYYIFKDKGNIIVNKGTVDEIVLQKDGKIIYFVSDYYDELDRTDLLHVTKGDTNDANIGRKIRKLLENGQ